MSKFTFICEDEPMPFSNGVVTKRTFEFDAIQLQDIVEEFERFLIGAGFGLNGKLEIVEDTYELTEAGHDVMSQLEEWTHANNVYSSNRSEHYYDTERNKPSTPDKREFSNWVTEYDKAGNCSK